jgi:hypothetical protein
VAVQGAIVIASNVDATLHNEGAEGEGSGRPCSRREIGLSCSDSSVKMEDEEESSAIMTTSYKACVADP